MCAESVKKPPSEYEGISVTGCDCFHAGTVECVQLLIRPMEEAPSTDDDDKAVRVFVRVERKIVGVLKPLQFGNGRLCSGACWR